MKTRHLTAQPPIRLYSAGLWTSLLICGCATTPGASPHEMSAAQHEAAARQEDRAVAGHANQFDPNAAVTTERCGVRVGVALLNNAASDGCWTSVTNPTNAHLQEAADHRRHAADHRAGSASLRDAEARACVAISADDRDISPFERTEDIESVKALNSPPTGGKQPTSQLLGATVVFRAVPGMTAEWLQRIVDCHLARNASLGHVVPEMPNCPLVPKGAAATVSSTGNGFAVHIRSDEPAIAREILERAQRLLATTRISPTSQR